MNMRCPRTRGGRHARPTDWPSSDPSDVIVENDGCTGTLTFGNPGPRALTLEVDEDGATGSASIALYVEG